MSLRSKFSRSLLAASVAALALAPAARAEMTDAERAEFRAEVRAYLLDHPEVIYEAVDALQARQAAAAATADEQLVQAYADQIFDDGFSWVGGNPEGDITLVEFIDYRCGYCRRAYPEVEELVESDGNIRLVVKEFPILTDESRAGSRLALATKLVAGDEAYKEVHDALIRYDGAMDEVSMTRLLKALGLEADPILAQMDSDDVNQMLDATKALARQMGISGTPTFILGDSMLRGYAPLDTMRSLVAEEREQG